MEFELEWDGGPEDLTITTSGLVSVAAFDEMVQIVMADQKYQPGLRILEDHRLADWSGMTTSDLRQTAEMLEQEAASLGSHRVAVLVGRRAEYGIGRMLQAFLDQTTVEFRLFYDIDEARVWLMKADRAGLLPGST